MGDAVGNPTRRNCTRVGTSVFHKDFRGALTERQERQYCKSYVEAPKENVQRLQTSRKKLSIIGRVHKKCLRAEVSLSDFPACVCKEVKNA